MYVGVHIERMVIISYADMNVKYKNQKFKKKKGKKKMKKLYLYDVSAYDECGIETDPSRGEYILASSGDEAIKTAMDMAEEQGLQLYNFHIVEVIDN